MQAVRVVLFCILLLCGVTSMCAEDITPEPCLADVRDSMEEICENAYNERYDNAMELDLLERRREICCSLDAFEQCSITAYYQSGCTGEIPTLRQSLKAARLFTTVLTNVSCSDFRGTCSGSDTPKLELWLFILALSSAVIYAGKIM